MFLNLVLFLLAIRAEDYMVCTARGVEHQNGIDYMTFDVKSQGVKDAVLLGSNSPDFKHGDSNHMSLSPEHISRERNGEVVKVMCPQNTSNFSYKYYAVAFYDKGGGSVTSIPFQNNGSGNIAMMPLSGDMTSTTNASGQGMQASQYNGYTPEGMAAGSNQEAIVMSADGSNSEGQNEDGSNSGGSGNDDDQEDNGVPHMTIYSVLGLFIAGFLAL